VDENNKTDKMNNSSETDDLREFLTTGQAAALCSVTRNAVFKWIQSGYLSAYRTAGGHHRIDKRELERFMSVSEPHPAKPAAHVQGKKRRQYCWEYNGNGKVQGACLDCAVYSLRALRCYEVAKLAPDANHPKMYCNERCEDCDYFREMHGKIPNILVVTNDPMLASGLIADAEGAGFNLEITDCEYSCSAIVHHFKPDFVIVDCLLGRKISRQISHHLKEDPRIPYVKVVFAADREDFMRTCDREVFAQIARPFGIRDIQECISLVAEKN
jgi:excisionase family DNA binding protein